MKRFFMVVLSAFLAVSLLGCTEKKEEKPIQNDVFTDAYFEGLKQVSLMGLTGNVSGEEMQKVVDLLQNVSLAPAGNYLPAEEKPVLLILGFEDGTSKTLSNLMTMELVAPDRRQATRLSRLFEIQAEAVYSGAMNTLLQAEDQID